MHHCRVLAADTILLLPDEYTAGVVVVLPIHACATARLVASHRLCEIALVLLHTFGGLSP